METKKRTKYYPINLKDEQLHNDFMVEKQQKRFKNVDQMVQYLLYHDKISQNMSMSSLERLGKLTRTNETWDDLINRILDEREEADKRIRELEQEIERLKGDEKQ